MKSEVEQLYERLQQQQGGSVPWHQLNPQYQHVFIQAVNNLLQIAALKG